MYVIHMFVKVCKAPLQTSALSSLGEGLAVQMRVCQLVCINEVVGHDEAFRLPLRACKPTESNKVTP